MSGIILSTYGCRQCQLAVRFEKRCGQYILLTSATIVIVIVTFVVNYWICGLADGLVCWHFISA